MRIQGIGAGFDSGIVDRIMEAEKAPLKAIQTRRDGFVAQKNEYGTLSGLLGDLDKAANSLKLPSSFRQLSFKSSNPDVLDGVVDGVARPGTYEFEVKGLASADKFLESGFPDRDKTPVGFGYMQIEREGGKLSDVIIRPGSTLNDVASAINTAEAGVHASIVNTGMADDPFKLLVVSDKTGEEAKIHLDPDTTFLNFKNIKPARNLDVKFDDIDVTRRNNKLDDLVDGVKINAKRAAPGTKIQVSILHDLEKTIGNVKAFTDKFNQVAKFMNSQFMVDSASHKPTGKLAGDGNVRSMLRSLQSQMAQPIVGKDGKMRSLAEVGITTNAKTGELQVDEKKLKGALASDYEGTAALFTQSASGPGFAARIADVVHRFEDPVSGPLSNRQRGLDRIIRDQDKQIEDQTRRLDERRESLERQFSAMQSRVDSLNSQGEILAARLGGGMAAPPAPAGGGKGA